jgi:hypothetical protein
VRALVLSRSANDGAMQTGVIATLVASGRADGELANHPGPICG